MTQIKQSNKDTKRNDKRFWYIGSVVDVMDPEKRRRLKVRLTAETNLKESELRWIQPLLMSSSDFQLPAKDEPVLILRFDDLYLWIELPNKESWQHMSDEDYPTAEMHKHKDVFEYEYLESKGFRLLLNAILNMKIKNLDVHVNENIANMKFNDFGIEFTDNVLTLGNQGSGNAKIEIDLNTGVTTFNSNALNSFLIDINKQVSRMNIIEKDINALKGIFTAWVPSPYDGGGALKAGASAWASQQLIITNVDDIKDPLLKN